MTTTLRPLASAAAVIALSGIVACGSGSAATASPGAPPEQAAPAASAASGGGIFTGQVAETMNAGGYTYVKLQNDAASVWAAALEFPVEVGERLTVPLESPMTGFSSKTLNRTFPLIYFVSNVARDGETLPRAAGAGAPGLAASHEILPGGAPSGDAPAAQVEQIAPPAGGMAIADVWAKRTALGGTRVTISGKVVKVNNGILGRNWIHLQDGSGSEAAHTNDLTVTTDAEVKMGDVVTATGTLGLDKDFGAGYLYDAILEGATVTVARAAD